MKLASNQQDFFPDLNPKAKPDKPERPCDCDDFEEEECPACFELLSKHSFNQIIKCALKLCNGKVVGRACDTDQLNQKPTATNRKFSS